MQCTVWKFLNFSITQILRETKVGDFRDPKTAIVIHLETLIFYFDDFFHFLKALKYTKIQNSEPLKMQKWQFFNFHNPYN